MARVSKKEAAKKAVAKATIYNTSIKSKSEMRAESEDALTAFLKKGGVIQECKPSRRGAKAGRKMTGKSSRGFVTGTSGFANGFPKRTVGA
jgi:hypothetical protein